MSYSITPPSAASAWGVEAELHQEAWVDQEGLGGRADEVALGDLGVDPLELLEEPSSEYQEVDQQPSAAA